MAVSFFQPSENAHSYNKPNGYNPSINTDAQSFGPTDSILSNESVANFLSYVTALAMVATEMVSNHGTEEDKKTARSLAGAIESVLAQSLQSDSASMAPSGRVSKDVESPVIDGGASSTGKSDSYVDDPPVSAIPERLEVLDGQSENSSGVANSVPLAPAGSRDGNFDGHRRHGWVPKIDYEKLGARVAMIVKEEFEGNKGYDGFEDDGLGPKDGISYPNRIRMTTGSYVGPKARDLYF